MAPAGMTSHRSRPPDIRSTSSARRWIDLCNRLPVGQVLCRRHTMGLSEFSAATCETQPPPTNPASSNAVIPMFFHAFMPAPFRRF